MNEQRIESPAALNALSERVIGAAIEVHRELGRGLLEGIYEEALTHEFGLRGLSFETQVELPLTYKGVVLRGQRMDIVVEEVLVLELKAVEAIANVHLAQLLSYLRAAHLPLGLLINFHTDRLIDGVRRRINSRAMEHPQSISATSANAPRPLR
jgi:GxxExxY protein